MNNAEYQNFPGVSSHRLMTMLESPAACWRKYLDPARSDPVQTESMLLGTMVHVLALTPHEFDDEFLVADYERRSKAGKVRFAELQQYGLKVVRPREFEKANAIVDALLADSTARHLLNHGIHERIFIEPRGDGLLPLKARLDVHQEAQRRVVELKTTNDITRLHKVMTEYHYLLSAAFYRYISKSNNVTFIFVQTAEPFTVEIFEPTNLQLDQAAERVDDTLRRFDACWRANDWPEAEPALADFDDDPLMMSPSFFPTAPNRPRSDLPLGEMAL